MERPEEKQNKGIYILDDERVYYRKEYCNTRILLLNDKK